jgi:16S rRNA A1518/A1519 N6-dimethyltransferase RsmA/KsgA/DIM1 with predicted DNA glycosylase/AP lyase activity
MNMEQVFLKEKIAENLRLKIAPLILENCNILEIGIGTGMFTKTYQKPNQNILAFEIDDSLTLQIPSHNITLINEGFNTELIEILDFDYLISSPPYFLLKEISEFIKLRELKYVLMVGKKYLSLFDNCKIIDTLESSDFSIPTKSEHYVITNI